MRARFHYIEFTDPITDLVCFRQLTTVEEYYEEFEALLNLLQLLKDYALSIFVSNLKSEISKFVRLFHPKTLTHALNLAKQIEAIIHNPIEDHSLLTANLIIPTYFTRLPKILRNHNLLQTSKHCLDCYPFLRFLCYLTVLN